MADEFDEIKEQLKEIRVSVGQTNETLTSHTGMLTKNAGEIAFLSTQVSSLTESLGLSVPTVEKMITAWDKQSNLWRETGPAVEKMITAWDEQSEVLNDHSAVLNNHGEALRLNTDSLSRMEGSFKGFQRSLRWRSAVGAVAVVLLGFFVWQMHASVGAIAELLRSEQSGLAQGIGVQQELAQPFEAAVICFGSEPRNGQSVSAVAVLDYSTRTETIYRFTLSDDSASIPDAVKSSVGAGVPSKSSLNAVVNESKLSRSLSAIRLLKDARRRIG